MEKWLLQVQDVMFVSIRDVLEKSIQAYLEVPRVKWVRDWPGQIALAVSQIYWTQGAHEAIRNTQGGMKEYHEKLKAQVYCFCCYLFLDLN